MHELPVSANLLTNRMVLLQENSKRTHVSIGDGAKIYEYPNLLQRCDECY